jgi:hypothetical protein
MFQDFTARGESRSLAPVYSLLSNLQLAQARKAPKLILPNPRTLFAPSAGVLC